MSKFMRGNPDAINAFSSSDEELDNDSFESDDDAIVVKESRKRPHPTFEAESNSPKRLKEIKKDESPAILELSSSSDADDDDIICINGGRASGRPVLGTLILNEEDRKLQELLARYDTAKSKSLQVEESVAAAAALKDLERKRESERIAKLKADAEAARVAKEVAAAEQAERVVPMIDLKFVRGRKDVTNISVFINAKFSDIKLLYCEKCSVDASKVTFILDGDTLGVNCTPEDEDLESGDQIDVKVL